MTESLKSSNKDEPLTESDDEVTYPNLNKHPLRPKFPDKKTLRESSSRFSGSNLEKGNLFLMKNGTLKLDKEITTSRNDDSKKLIDNPFAKMKGLTSFGPPVGKRKNGEELNQSSKKKLKNRGT